MYPTSSGADITFVLYFFTHNYILMDSNVYLKWLFIGSSDAGWVARNVIWNNVLAVVVVVVVDD